MKAGPQSLTLVLLCLIFASCGPAESERFLIIPLRTVYGGDLHVEAAIDGKRLLLLVDSGSSVTAVDRRMVEALSLPPPCKTVSDVNLVTGTTDREEHFHNVELAMGGRVFVLHRLQACDFSTVMPMVSDPLASAVGVLGTDFLLSTGAIVDFRRGEIRVPLPLVSRIKSKREQPAFADPAGGAAEQ